MNNLHHMGLTRDELDALETPYRLVLTPVEIVLYLAIVGVICFAFGFFA